LQLPIIVVILRLIAARLRRPATAGAAA